MEDGRVLVKRGFIQISFMIKTIDSLFFIQPHKNGSSSHSVKIPKVENNNQSLFKKVVMKNISKLAAISFMTIENTNKTLRFNGKGFAPI